jgi:predicted nucleic acid-binding protein
MSWPTATRLIVREFAPNSASLDPPSTAAAWRYLQHDLQFVVVATTVKQLEAAVEIFQKQKQSVSLTDCIVMAVADEYDTKDIFGFDRQFEQAGYKSLRAVEPSEKAA